LLVTIVIGGGAWHSVATFGSMPDIRTGYNGALSLLTENGQISAEQLRTALSITVNERHIQRHNLAIALRNEGRLEDAIEQLELVTRRRPTYHLAHRDLGHLLMGSDPTTALSHLQSAIHARPNDGETWFLLGNALAMGGRWSPAVGAYQKAVEFGVRRPNVHHNLATALRQVGAKAQAIEEYRRALALDPNYQRSKQALERFEKR
jgi:tetratricopeptide (TPR) repeat protein